MVKIKIMLTKKANKPAMWTGNMKDVAVAILNHHGDAKRPIFLGGNNRVLIPLHRGDYIMIYSKSTERLETYQIRNFEADVAICRTVSVDSKVPEIAQGVIADMYQENFVPPFNASTSWYKYVVENAHTERKVQHAN